MGRGEGGLADWVPGGGCETGTAPVDKAVHIVLHQTSPWRLYNHYQLEKNEPWSCLHLHTARTQTRTHARTHHIVREAVYYYMSEPWCKKLSTRIPTRTHTLHRGMWEYLPHMGSWVISAWTHSNLNKDKTLTVFTIAEEMATYKKQNSLTVRTVTMLLLSDWFRMLCVCCCSICCYRNNQIVSSRPKPVSINCRARIFL